MPETSTKTVLHDREPSTACFLEEVQSGLSASPKSLPCKYLYDEAGSHLFDRICELEEYYVTRAELEIMSRASGEMAAQLGRDVLLVEYGSGSGIKTELLLDQLIEPSAYVPVEISRSHLQQSAERLNARYPTLEVLPVCADFTEWFELPTPRRPASHAAVYFPGSTIGNFEPGETRRLLAQIAGRCGSGGGLLIGIDLQKASETLEAAYDDRAGVTAAFSLNLLKRMQRELEAELNVEDFRHEAIYNEALGRIEISLVSQTEQTIRVGDVLFTCGAGERIHTEYSHKYTVDGFASMAAEEGFELHQAWTDSHDRFAVLHLVVTNSS